MTKLKLAYFGTPDFSANLLEKLITDGSINQLIDIKLVVTQPDRPVGRKQILTPTPVKLIANKYNVPVYDNLETGVAEEGLPTARTQGALAGGNPKQAPFRNLDFCLLYAYGEKIPNDLLDKPRLGFINIHPSLLPKYRGPSPIAYPLINGDQKTGVTLIKMDDQIDHGPIITQEELEILPTDKRSDLEKKLTKLAFEIFKKIMKGSIPCFSPASPRGAQAIGSKQVSSPFIQQDHSQATYTKLLKKSDGFVSFKNFKLKIKNSPKQLFDLFRGLYPWPGLWTLLCPPNRRTSEGQALKRLRITDIDFKDGKLIIKKVQIEGKKEVDFKTFQEAYKVF